MGFGHLHIQAKSVDASAAFYTEHLGFEEIMRQGEMAILRDETGLAFFIDPSPTGEPIPASVHIGFRLKTPQEVAELYGDLKDKVKILQELQVDDGFSVFTIEDPDQMMIEIFYSVL